MMVSTTRTLALLGFVLTAPALRAHDFWIEPSSLRPQPGERVAVRLRQGEHLQGDPVPRNPERIERFAVVGQGGEARVGGRAGADPAGWISAPASPGLYWIVYDNNHAFLEQTAEKFDRYLDEEGLERVRELGRSKTGTVKEIYSRCAKSLLAVGATAGTGWDRALGLDLELVLERNPYDLKTGETLPVRLLYRGQPLAGALVKAVAANAEVSGRSDGHGRAELRLDRPGLWLIKSVHMVPAPEGSEADWESLWASVTFELGVR